jgi:hypothetical protein
MERSEIPAAEAVRILLAPVVAQLRGDAEGYGMLVDDAANGAGVPEIVRAAPALARVYLRIAPPPGGARAIVDSYPHAAGEQFGDREVVTLGAECLTVAMASERIGARLAGMAEAVFVTDALDHGARPALEGAIAPVWWAAYLSARMRGTDPVEETAAICRWAARAA